MKNFQKNVLQIRHIIVVSVFSVLASLSMTMPAVSAGVNIGMGAASMIPILTQNKAIQTVDDLMRLPLLSIDNFQYIGGFRIRAGTHGESISGWSDGKMTYNDDAHTLFITGNSLDAAIGEFPIPPLVNSDNYTDLNITDNPKQPYVKILDRVRGRNTQYIDKIGGMAYINGELLIQVYEFYDGNADNTFTSLVARNANDLKSSPIDGFFEFSGAAHTVLWVSPVSDELRTLFEGDYMLGASSALSINGRSSMGPSAFVLKSNDIIGTSKVDGVIPTRKMLDFDLYHIMAKTTQGWLPFVNGWEGNLQYNYSGPKPPGADFAKVYDKSLVGDNDLWTQGSGAFYGLIIPGTRTYAVFGSSGMHNSGGGYKIVQTNGHQCGGPCQYDASDKYNYYWFFDIKDLYDVRMGKVKPYEVKPYKYGLFKTPFDKIYVSGSNEPIITSIAAGAFNRKEGIIYFSLPGVDKAQHRDDPPSVIMAFKINK